ncbi:MAG: hypothetical protein LUF68_04210 [Clostridiales bacterium]|nr:hypothetical protein [Clostridiales bacterium]
MITDAELDALPKITPAIAAEYLQGELNVLTIRYRAQRGRCPFCTAERSGSGGRWTYHINGTLLKRYKAGEFHPAARRAIT